MKNQSFLNRFKFAFSGIFTTIKEENSFKTQLLAFIFVLVLLFTVQPKPIWWALLILTCGLVLVAELINTALEALMDHIHPDIHPNIKKSKDAAAGAVLVMSLTSLGMAVAFVWAHWLSFSPIKEVTELFGF